MYYALGLAEFAQQHYQVAADAWEQVRRDAPEFETVYFFLADAYSLQHQELTAMKVLREAETRWPSDAEAANALGVIQIRRGALDAAIESFAHATTVAAADSLGYFNLGRTYQMRLAKEQRYVRETKRWMVGRPTGATRSTRSRSTSNSAARTKRRHAKRWPPSPGNSRPRASFPFENSGTPRWSPPNGRVSTAGA